MEKEPYGNHITFSFCSHRTRFFCQNSRAVPGIPTDTHAPLSLQDRAPWAAKSGVNSESSTGPGNWESRRRKEHTRPPPPHLRKQMGTSPIPRCKAREAGASTQTHPRDCRHGAGTRGGMGSTVRDKTPRISGGRVGTTRGKRRPPGGGRAGEESTVREASGNGRRGNGGRFRRASRAPGRLRACNRRLDASGRLEVPGRDRDPQTKIPSPRPRPARPPPPPSPNVHRPLPRPTERHGFQQSNPRLPRCRRPPGPFPPSALVAERKEKGGGGGARRPLTMIR